MGGANDSNEIAIKDAYMQYKTTSGMKVVVGNEKFPFSREQLTSSKKQQLVERSFFGSHNYGTPGRNLGLHLSGNASEKMISWGASIAQANIDPDANKLDFDTPVNKNTDFNEGFIFGGRVKFSFGNKVKFSQGDFSGKSGTSVGFGAYSWSNDSDNNTAGSKPDVDTVTGLEASAAYRGSGFSIDAQMNRFSADTVDSAFTGSIYRNGSTTLTNAAVETGYMISPKTFELVLGYQTQDADNYAVAWNRTSVGANWFIEKHKIKVQMAYRIGENLNGETDINEDELYIQTQYVF